MLLFTLLYALLVRCSNIFVMNTEWFSWIDAQLSITCRRRYHELEVAGDLSSFILMRILQMLNIITDILIANRPTHTLHDEREVLALNV